MHRRTTLLILFLRFSFFASSQETKPPNRTGYYPVPIAASREPNPVKSTPESIAEGKRIFAYDCAQCHGSAGDAKTDAGKDLKAANLTDPAVLKDRSDGAIFYILKNGHGDMPREGNRVKPEQLWDLVNYVRSLARKPPAADQKPSN
jgi:mono/diheme cytochrome c family protein